MSLIIMIIVPIAIRIFRNFLVRARRKGVLVRRFKKESILANKIKGISLIFLLLPFFSFSQASEEEVISTSNRLLVDFIYIDSLAESKNLKWTDAYLEANIIAVEVTAKVLKHAPSFEKTKDHIHYPYYQVAYAIDNKSYLYSFIKNFDDIKYSLWRLKILRKLFNLKFNY